MTQTQLDRIIRKHGNWLRCEEGGERAVLRDAVLSDANLSDANLSGADLSGADLRGANLSGANLSGADRRGAVLRGARGANLSGANLSDADLSGAVLRGANLSDADLSGAVLRGADLRGAVLRGADIPKVERLHTKMAEAIERGGALEMGSWHVCETTHCRAGWAIHIAGDAGKKLEDAVGSAAAGALIFAASYPDQRVPDFYASNETALADIKRCAAEEAK